MTDVVVRALTTEDSHDEYADLSIRAFGPEDPAGIWARSEATIADGRGVGAFEGGRLVGSAVFHELRQWWLGRAVTLAGVAGVKVAPECRGRGVGRALMTALIELMNERGYPLAALYAATRPIYRQLGWEMAGVRYEADIQARSLLSLTRADFPAQGTPPLRRPGPADAAEIIAVLGRVHELARDCGPILFSEEMMRRRLTAPGMYFDTGKFAYLAPDGFLAYRWNGGGLYIDKLVAASPETTRALWSVVASHSSVARTVRAQVAPADPVWWLLREEDATIATHKQWMLRLLDAPAAVAARGFPPVDLTVPLHITDDQVPANAGHWTLAIRSGAGLLTRMSAASADAPATASADAPAAATALHVGARGLAALYAGTPVATLRRAGLASGGAPESDAALNTAFAAAAFMLDDF
jgi:predicted acetyltransferase